jgi:hypothetical protein
MRPNDQARQLPGAAAKPRTRGVRFGDGSGLVIGRYFDEIRVRVAKVDRLNWTDCACSNCRTFDDWHSAVFQMSDDFRQWDSSDQANVNGTRRGVFGFGFKLASGLMEIDLLGAEGQRDAAGSKSYGLHTKHSRIELAGDADILNRHYKVVDVVDLHGCMDLGGQGLTVKLIGGPRRRYLEGTCRPIRLSAGSGS